MVDHGFGLDFGCFFQIKAVLKLSVYTISWEEKSVN